MTYNLRYTDATVSIANSPEGLQSLERRRCLRSSGLLKYEIEIITKFKYVLSWFRKLQFEFVQNVPDVHSWKWVEALQTWLCNLKLDIDPYRYSFLFWVETWILGIDIMNFWKCHGWNVSLMKWSLRGG